MHKKVSVIKLTFPGEKTTYFWFYFVLLANI